MQILERLKARGIEPRMAKNGKYIVDGVAYTLRQLVREFLSPHWRPERTRIVGVVDYPKRSKTTEHHVDVRVAFALAEKYGCSMTTVSKLLESSAARKLTA